MSVMFKAVWRVGFVCGTVGTIGGSNIGRVSFLALLLAERKFK